MAQDFSTTLLRLTGDLWPAQDTLPDALLDLRKALLSALRFGQDPLDVGRRQFPGDPAGGAEDEIRLLGDNPPAATNTRLSHRSTAIAAVDPQLGGPHWASGQTPSRTIGPFQDRGGRLHWFDVFAPTGYFKVFVFGDPEPVALLPAGTVPGPELLNLPAGSVWLRARLLTPTAPAGFWAGLKIDSGSATLSGPVQAAPGSILLLPQGGVTIVLNLATNGFAGFPASATVTISPNGIRAGEFGPGSLTAFGTTVSVAAAAGPVAYDAALSVVLLPLATDAARFQPGAGPFSGSAAIRSSAWALPLTEAPAAALAPAEGPGSIAVVLDAGLETTLPGAQGGNIALNKATILASPARNVVFAPAASNRRATQIYSAWFEDHVDRRSNFELSRRVPFPFWFFDLASGDGAVLTRAELTLHIDRPLRASGTRLESSIPILHLIEHDPAGTRVTLIASQPVDPKRRFALALSNVLLTVAESNVLELFAKLKTPEEMQSGVLNFALPVFQLLPTLPDPYAVNFDPRLNAQPSDNVRAAIAVIWTEPFAVQLDIRLDPPPFNMPSSAQVLPELNEFRDIDSLTKRYSATVPQEAHRGLCLLDVSSNAAQFGIALGFNDLPGGGVSIHDLTLDVAGLNATVFLLPQFQWEPVFNKANPKVLGETEGWRYSLDDGGPAQAAADIVRLVPVSPLRLLDEVVSTYSEEKRRAAILFTLPFGIRAVAVLNPLNPEFSKVPRLEIIAPRFDDLDGAPQLSLIAGKLQNGQSWITGRATPAPGPNSSPLGAVIGPAFDAAFQLGVPVESIALSGYGASLFSRWFLAQEEPEGVAITQVAFDALNGRTAYERVLMTTWLLPCFARLVRTITFERRGGGAVLRSDSGWVATTPGLFEHKDHTFHKCAVTGVHNIREIRDTSYVQQLSDNFELQAVYYDADIAIENPIRGADGNGRVAARRHLGFIQQLTIPAVLPLAGPITQPVINAAHLRELLQKTGPLGGPVDCQIKIGDSPHEMKVTSILAANAGNDHFAVGPYGHPALKAAGQWSVTRLNNGTGAVDGVDPARGIPLIRAGGGPYRWADPADLFQNNPATDYAFLFSSGAQRILFPRPQIENGAAKITSLVRPLLADPYSLIKAAGLFPPPNKAIPFKDANWGLESVGGLLRLSPSPFTVTVAPPAAASFNLLKTAQWAADVRYSDKAGKATEFVIDSAAEWAIKSSGIRQTLTFPVIGEVMTIVHEIAAPSVGADTFPNPQVLFAGALEDVADVLAMLRQWAPNLPAPLTVDASFSGSTFRLSAVADFNIEDSDGNAIDCGMGKLKGNLKVGAELSVEIFKRTTNGAVFFEITGTWQQLIFPLIYGGGLIRFKLRADNSGQTTLELDACVVGSIGGDLIPGLISIEATVKYGYFLFTNPIAPGFMAGIEGRAKLLSGLVGFKFGVEGRIGVTRIKEGLDPTDLCHLKGEILVAGTVTLAWMLEERRSFRTHFDVKVDWTLLLVAAKAGLLPVP